MSRIKTSELLQRMLAVEASTDAVLLLMEAMERKLSQDGLTSLMKDLQAKDYPAAVIGVAAWIYAEEMTRPKRRTYTRTVRTEVVETEYPCGPAERWGYEGPITPRLPEREWWALRNRVLCRDNHTCNYCGEQPDSMCADHVVPLSRGGTNEEDNLVACCIPCNSSKCDRLLSEWAGRYR